MFLLRILPIHKGAVMADHWRKLLPAVGIGVTISAVIAALILFSDSDDSPDSSNSAISFANDGGVGGGPEFIKPSRVTEGDWEPPGFRNLPTQDKPIAAQHVGEIINGIRILDFGQSAARACPGKQQAADLPFPFLATYLPPNSFEMAKPWVGTCPNGEIDSAGRSFQIGGEGALAIFGIVYAAAEPVAYGFGDIEPMTINDWPAVAIAPAKNNGVEVGQGAVVMDTPNGVIEVSGSGMPLDELVKIAQGLKCDKC
jgi:hypothetical protein